MFLYLVYAPHACLINIRTFESLVNMYNSPYLLVQGMILNLTRGDDGNLTFPSVKTRNT